MQPDHVLKKLNLNLLTPTSFQGDGLYGQNICYHAAAFCNSLLFDMQHDHDLKKLNFDLLTHSQQGGGGVGVGPSVG